MTWKWYKLFPGIWFGHWEGKHTRGYGPSWTLCIGRFSIMVTNTRKHDIIVKGFKLGPFNIKMTHEMA